VENLRNCGRFFYSREGPRVETGFEEKSEAE
jgi:hypothetical protein